MYVGGNRIYRQAVAPGPVEVGNLSYLLGQRDMRVVVRDAFGRERQLDLPFYFGARALAPGLQDFSYSVGAVREHVGVPGDEYGAGAFSAAHRIGETVLLVLYALGPEGPGGCNPLALSRVITGLRQIGLDSEARAIGMEAAIAAGV